ncbi:hypothetical protein ACFLQI_03085 [Candidatus Undinarchaeota archaeon]
MRRAAYVLFAIAVLLVPCLSADINIFVTLEGEHTRLNVDEQIPLTLTVFNPNDQTIKTSLEITGSIYSWATLKDTRIEVPTHSNISTILYVDPPFDAPAGAYSIGVTAYLTSDRSTYGKAGYTVTIMPREGVYVESSTDKSEYSLTDEVVFNAHVENLGNINYDDLSVRVKLLGSDVWSTEEKIALESMEKRTVRMNVDPKKVIAGNHQVITEVYDGSNYLANTTNQLTFLPVEDIIKTEESTSGFWRQTATITIENRGNTYEPVEIKKSFMPLEANFLSSSFEPAKSGIFSTTWALTVPPGETKTLEFYTYGTVLKIIDLILLLVIFAFLYMSGSKIANKPPAEIEKGMVGVYSKGGSMDLTVSLLIRNKSPQKLTNILVTDSVPNSVRVHNFRTARPSQINERKYDIEYMWSLPAMGPFEERALVYDISAKTMPKTLPQATVRSTNKQGKTLFHKSKLVRLGQD